METIFKVAVTAVVLCAIYYQLVFVRTVWQSQVDPRATFGLLMRKLKPDADVIATRDPQKIYQNGNPVGDVTGSVVQKDTTWVFKEMSNTTGLRPDHPFEYQRVALRIVSIASRAGMVVTMTDRGSTQARDVLTDVVCALVKK